jgi:hypothetical protein
VAIVVKAQMRSLAIAAVLLAACFASAVAKRVTVRSAPVTFYVSVPSGAGRLLLHLDDVVVPASEAAMLRVFVNAPAATATTSTSAPGFVEEMFLVPRSSGPRARSHGQNFVFPLPPAAKPDERLTITLIPIAANERGELSAAGAIHMSARVPYLTREH